MPTVFIDPEPYGGGDRSFINPTPYQVTIQAITTQQPSIYQTTADAQKQIFVPTGAYLQVPPFRSPQPYRTPVSASRQTTTYQSIVTNQVQGDAQAQNVRQQIRQQDRSAQGQTPTQATGQQPTQGTA